MVRFVVSIVAGILGAAIGLVVGWAIGEVLAKALDVSCFEGACGYFVALIALFSGLIGLFAGILLALVWRSRRAAPAPQTPAAQIAVAPADAASSQSPHAGLAGSTPARFVSAVAVIAGLVVGGIWLYAWIGDDTLASSNEATPQLLYEIRFPVGTVLPQSRDKVDVQLDTSKNQAFGYLFDDWRRSDGERPLAVGFFDLYYKAQSRILSIGLPDGPRYGFILKLPRAPGHMAEFSPWYPVDFIDEGTSDRPRKATGDEGMEIRYRVVYAGRD